MKRKDKILSKLEHLKRIKKITDILDKEAKREMEDHLGGINEMPDEELFASMVNTDLTYKIKPRSRRKVTLIVTGRRKGRPAQGPYNID